MQHSAFYVKYASDGSVRPCYPANIPWFAEHFDPLPKDVVINVPLTMHYNVSVPDAHNFLSQVHATALVDQVYLGYGKLTYVTGSVSYLANSFLLRCVDADSALLLKLTLTVPW